MKKYRPPTRMPSNTSAPLSVVSDRICSPTMTPRPTSTSFVSPPISRGRTSSRRVVPASAAGFGADSVAGRSSLPENVTSAAPTTPIPGGSVTPTFAGVRPRTETGSELATAPCGTCSASPLWAATDPPSGPSVEPTRGPGGGANNSTVITPCCNVSGSNVCDGVTANTAPNPDAGPPT